MAEPLQDPIKQGSDIDRLIKRKLKIMDNADEDYLNSLEPTQNAVLKAVMGIVNKFDVVDGRLASTETNRQLLASLNKEVSKIINDSTYTKKIEPYLRDFDKITKLTFDIQEVGNGIKGTKVNPNPIKRQYIDDLTLGLTGEANVETNLVKPIRDVLFNAIVLNQGQVETRQQLETLITGAGTRQGILKRYAGQIARDSINQYDGKVNAVIANEYGLNAYRYVGSLVTDSRAQCVRWVGKGVLPIDTLQSEINWAYNNGQGMIRDPRTTPETFAIDRGGYNCRHAAIPFRQVEGTPKPLSPNSGAPIEATEEVRTDEDLKPLIQGAPPNVTKYKKQKNVKGVKNWMEKNNLADLVDFEGVHIDVANSWGEAIFNNVKLFPELRDNLKFVGTMQARNELFIERQSNALLIKNKALYEKLYDTQEERVKQARKTARSQIGRINKRAFGESMKRSPSQNYANGISINRNLGKSAKEALAIGKAQKESKWWTIGGDKLNYIVNHELGHEIDSLIGLIKDKDFLKIYNRERRKGVTHVKDNLSLYAVKGRNPKAEFIAESWAEFMTAESPREISTQIGELILKKYNEKFVDPNQ